MRARTFLIAGLLVLAAAPEAAQAQFSPRGLLNGITRPFRQILGGLGHFPRGARSRIPARTAAAGAATSVAAATALGVSGPPAWPNAYEQTIGYALWPNDYAQTFRSTGFDVIADTITGEGEQQPAARTATSATTQNDANAAPSCSDGVPNNWPSERIGQTTQLTNAQSDAVQKLQASVSLSTKNLNCNRQTTQTAPERLQALIGELWSVRDSAIAASAPLKDFYGTLTDAQKVSYTVQQPPQQRAQPTQPATTGSAANLTAGADPAAQRAVQACAQQNAEAAERMTKTIEMRARPNREQQASLENLHKVSGDMAKLLMAACTQPIPADPVARLDAANDRLTTLNYAATSVQVAFGDFYSRLNDAQKARLDNPNR